MKIAWKELATRSDEFILNYFKTEKQQNERYAANSLRFLRRQYGHGAGTASATPAPSTLGTPTGLPANGWTVEPEPATNPPTAAAPSPAVAPVALPPGVEPGLGAIAQMLAPHLAGLIAPNLEALNDKFAALRLSVRDELETAVAKAGDKIKAYVPTRIVTLTPPAEPKPLDGVHHEAAAKLIALATQRVNVMLVGPAGCGKTVLASSVARAVELPLTCISCSAGMSEAQLLGRLLPLGAGGAFQYVESPFIKAYAGGGVILLDEIDAADANLLLVINAALANNTIEIEARAASGLPTRVTRHPETIILAAANTWGAGADTQYMGRGALDASTLDRFYRLAIDYDPKLESGLGGEQTVTWVQNARKRAREHKLRRVISTRAITRIEAALNAGLAWDEVIRDELASWSVDERAKIGEA